MGKINSTTGELLFALLMASVASVFAAITGVIGVTIVFLPIYGAEKAGWAPLFFGLLASLVFGVIGFVLVFRWVENYGDPKSGDAGNEPN